MAIIPTMKCNEMDKSVSFYTKILDFVLVGTWPEKSNPSFSVLNRNGDELHLSSHQGDGTFGSVVAVIVSDIDGLFEKYIARGLNTKAKLDSPVHQGPTNQTWGTREFYVDDPDGNTIRFVQR
jgi:catechol 2,3-dioxygenase-like lactoylglutathione lyase family enzyme